MGNKLRVGMLCKFKQNKQHFWIGQNKNAKSKKREAPLWLDESFTVAARFSKRHVTVIGKSGMLQEGKWVSVCQVLGIDMAGNPLTAWVLSHKLRMSAIPE